MNVILSYLTDPCMAFLFFAWFPDDEQGSKRGGVIDPSVRVLSNNGDGGKKKSVKKS